MRRERAAMEGDGDGDGDDGGYRRYSSPTHHDHPNPNYAAAGPHPGGSGHGHGHSGRGSGNGHGGSGHGSGRSPRPPTSPTPRGRTTDLHAACAAPSSSLSKLRATLLALGPRAAAAKDENDALPLHLLGRNELLVHLFLNRARYDDGGGPGGGSGGLGSPLSAGGTADPDGDGGGGGAGTPSWTLGGSGAPRPPRTELDPFVVEMVRAYPRALISTDATGRIPLVDAIYDWIEFSTKDAPLGEDEEGEEGGRYAGVDRPSRLGMGSARGGGEGSYMPGSDRVVGMSELMGHGGGDDDGASRRSRSVRTGVRSVLENVTLGSAFRSAYDASHMSEGASRAAYRGGEGDDGGAAGRGLGALGDDPAARQQAEFRNVWSATAPRPDGPSDEGRSASRHGSGGDVSGPRPPSNPVQREEDRDEGMDDVFPLNLAMPPVVEWSLRMISVLLDGIEGPLGADASEGAWPEDRSRDPDDRSRSSAAYGVVTSGDSAWIGTSLVAAVAAIPSFLKTLLLLNDDDPAKARVFRLSIVRRVISSRDAVGNWIVYMLEAVDPVVARRGVDFLEILSEDEDENALIPSTRRVRFAGTQLAPAARAALYYEVSRLDYFLPAVLALEETPEVDRASKTKLLRHVLDRELGSRPTLSMAFFDLFFLVMLLVTFQMSVYRVVEGNVVQPDAQYAATYFLSMFGALYGILRKFGQMSSMIKISRQAFVENNFRWVDGVDWLAILLVIGGIVWMEVVVSNSFEVTDYTRSYLAAAILSVWLKLVSWLSVINWQVINLVSLYYQIASGIRWILFFLLIAICASSQMLYVMLSGQDCNADGYCEKKTSYLQVWAMLLGQFDVVDFRTTASVLTFVAFTFTTFVVFGYTLIATSIDVYNKAVTFRSENNAYGNRARLVYIAELRAFRRLFDQRWTVMQYCAALLFLTSTVVLFLFAAGQIRASLGVYYSGGVLGGAVVLLLVFLFVSITAFVSHMTYYSFVGEANSRRTCTGALCRCIASSCVVKFFALPVERFMRFVVDIDGIHLDGTPSTAKYTDSWQGSGTHVRCHVKRMLLQSEAHISYRLRSELSAMETSHQKANERSRMDVLTEIRASEERMERMISNFQGWMDRRLSHKDE